MNIKVPFIKTRRPKISYDSDFKSIVENICKDGGSGTFHLYRRSDDSIRKYNMIADGEVKDLKDTDPEHWLKASYGGGEYQLRLDKTKGNGDEEIIKTFIFNIEGEPKESRTENIKRKETEASNTLEIIKTSFDMAKDMKGGNTDMAMMVAIMQESTKQTSLMFTQMMDMQNKSHESMMAMMREQKDSTNPVTEALENIMQLKEVETMMSPKIERDGTLEWFKAISNNPLLAGLASKAMNIEIPQSPQLPMIQSALPGSLGGNGNHPEKFNKSINIGSPSGSVNNSETNPSIKNDQKATPFPAPPGNGGTEHSPENTGAGFESAMISPLLDAINDGIDAPNIAVIIVQIIQWSVTVARIGQEVHPLMKGFVDFMLTLGESDIIDFNALDKTYTDFCSAIEMPSELVIPVKQELLRQYTPIFQQIMASRKEKPKDSVIKEVVSDVEEEAV